ncbi:response regulator transcription factor [Serratia sp. NPDC078593]|uniref:response regulator transcription factor n=1 Tax=unclassified Serratia (in: enterobacteria) TaxID=2647522 RepID=UPI0037D370CB
MTVTILLIDNDRYFAEGLRQGISQYFNQRGINTLFTRNIAYKNHADIAFVAKELGRKMGYGYTFSCPSRQRVFLINDHYHAQIYPSRLSKENTVFISRSQSLESLLYLLDQALLIQEKMGTPSEPDTHTVNPPILTRREYQVMRHLLTGMNNHAIGLQLNMSEKTVSAHKRAAMRKLNISQNIELNYWLLSGGLSVVNVFKNQPLPPN